MAVLLATRGLGRIDTQSTTLASTGLGLSSVVVIPPPVTGGGGVPLRRRPSDPEFIRHIQFLSASFGVSLEVAAEVTSIAHISADFPVEAAATAILTAVGPLAAAVSMTVDLGVSVARDDDLSTLALLDPQLAEILAFDADRIEMVL